MSSLTTIAVLQQQLSAVITTAGIANTLGLLAGLCFERAKCPSADRAMCEAWREVGALLHETRRAVRAPIPGVRLDE